MDRGIEAFADGVTRTDGFALPLAQTRAVNFLIERQSISDASRARWLIAVALLLALLLPLFSLWWITELKEFATYPTTNRIERWIAAELPTGTDQQEVLAFLDRHRIGHGEYHRIRDEEKQLSQEFNFFGRDKLAGKLDRVQHRIYAGSTVATWASFTTCWAHVWFYFDGNGKLVEYVIDSFCDGL
jgi:hypothetical protein